MMKHNSSCPFAYRALWLSALVSISCADDKDPPEFADASISDGLVGDGSAGDTREEFVENPDCPAAGLVISEIVYSPTSGEPEWVELRGPADLLVDRLRLTGVNGNGGSEFFDVVLEGGLGSDGRYLIASGALEGADQLSDDLTMQNGPDNLTLRDCGGQIVDAIGYGNFGEIDTFRGEGDAAPSTSQGESLARCAEATDTNDNAADFHVSLTPTPGATNDNFEDPFACEECIGGAFDGVTINELLYDPPGSDSIDTEFLELAGPVGLDLFGLQVTFVNGNDGAVYETLNLEGTIPRSGYVLIGGGGETALPGTLQNGPDGVVLIDCEGSVVDALGYGEFEGDISPGEGGSAEDVSDGSSLARCADSSDTDNNAADFHAATPTPGAENSGFTDVIACGGEGCFAGALDGRLVINELATGEEGAFVEVSGAVGIGIEDAYIETFDGAGELLSSEILIGSTDDEGLALAELLTLGTDGGTAILYDCQDEVLDTVAWGTGEGLDGEGDPAPAPGEGESIARCPEGTDTDDNLTDFHLATATPWEPNADYLTPAECGLVDCEPGALDGEVVINEVLYDPDEADGTHLTFIEIRGTPGAVLAGTTLVARNRSSGAEGDVVELTGVVPASGFYVVGQDLSDEDFRPNLLSDFTDLVNVGGGVDLIDCDGRLVDSVAYGEVTAAIGEGDPATGLEGESLARCPAASLADADSDDNSVDFERSNRPTPGASNLGFVEEDACEGICLPGSLTGQLVVNELRVTGTDAWVELYSRADIDLTDARIEVSDGTNTVVGDFDGDGLPTRLSSGDYLVIADSELGSVTGEIVVSGTGWPSGDDDTAAVVVVYDCSGSVVDVLRYGDEDLSPAEGDLADTPTSVDSIARCDDSGDSDDNSLDFHISARPSPGFVNGDFRDLEVCLAPRSELAGLLVINELMVDPVGIDANFLTFIELRGSSGQDLAGLELIARHRDTGAENGSLELSGTIGATGLWLIGQNHDDDGFSPDVTDDFADLVNGGAIVEIVDGEGLIVDAIAYGAITTEDVGEGDPAPSTGANDGESLARGCGETVADVDTDDNVADFTPVADPTPGLVNDESCF
jgi:hypothetical protein